MSDTEKSEECDSCGWETTALTETSTYGGGEGWLCEVCRSTRAGNAYLYPNQYRENIDVLATIAWGINYLAEKISPSPSSTPSDAVVER